ncbi:hypothetical protein AM1_5615 [Acaryochloris marina MBIC11017]|uniref:Uncharacterized protein n=1 Tax=Acaryochloris marina (strain MBIC 11017) TaxID=329726 RepID=B0CF49_ACAM1|nr:hypothetical protein AM1_5615 [Acaryochloris marina MBIC11017]
MVSLKSLVNAMMFTSFYAFAVVSSFENLYSLASSDFYILEKLLSLGDIRLLILLRSSPQ